MSASMVITPRSLPGDGTDRRTILQSRIKVATDSAHVDASSPENAGEEAGIAVDKNEAMVLCIKLFRNF
jgi:hypothetical protein